MDKFKALLQRFSKNTASQQEAEEFLRLSHNEEAVGEIEKHMDRILAREDIKRGLDDEELSESLQRILSAERAPMRTTAFRKFWMAAAAFVLIIAAAGLWLYIDTMSEQEKTHSFSGRHYLRLPDGSGVTLKEGSKLSYADTFNDHREVWLSGEAFFEVTHDAGSPFRVHAGDVTTTVLGTAFNVKTSQTNEVTITVTRGKVAVGDNTRDYGTITRNEQLAVNTARHEVVKTTVDTTTAVQWKEEYFILDRVTIAEAARQIGKRFNVDVNITNKNLEHCVITTWFLHNEDLAHVVESISALCQARYTITGNNVTIEGGVGCD